jgi:hypothetical protein
MIWPMSEHGTSRPIQQVCCSVAPEGKADVDKIRKWSE